MNILNDMPVNRKPMAGFGRGVTAYTEAQVTTMNDAAVMLEHSMAVDSLVGQARPQEKKFRIIGDQKPIDNNAGEIEHVGRIGKGGIPEFCHYTTLNYENKTVV